MIYYCLAQWCRGANFSTALAPRSWKVIIQWGKNNKRWFAEKIYCAATAQSGANAETFFSPRHWARHLKCASRYNHVNHTGRLYEKGRGEHNGIPLCATRTHKDILQPTLAYQLCNFSLRWCEGQDCSAFHRMFPSLSRYLADNRPACKTGATRCAALRILRPGILAHRRRDLYTRSKWGWNVSFQCCDSRRILVKFSSNKLKQHGEGKPVTWGNFGQLDNFGQWGNFGQWDNFGHILVDVYWQFVLRSISGTKFV